ncbi:MAG: hypothetical protein WBN71_02060 [Acidimicrobiia bacterium]
MSRADIDVALANGSELGRMMYRTIMWIAAVAILATSCSSTGADDDAPSSETTAAVASTETTTTTSVSTTTISATTSTEAVATTEAPSRTSTTTTTEPPDEVNPPEVEAWWCDTFEVAAGQSPTDFAQGLEDDFRHGYSDVPADNLEDAADQAALVSCNPEYGKAVADALRG